MEYDDDGILHMLFGYWLCWFVNWIINLHNIVITRWVKLMDWLCECVYTGKNRNADYSSILTENYMCAQRMETVHGYCSELHAVQNFQVKPCVCSDDEIVPEAISTAFTLFLRPNDSESFLPSHFYLISFTLIAISYFAFASGAPHTGYAPIFLFHSSFCASFFILYCDCYCHHYWCLFFSSHFVD